MKIPKCLNCSEQLTRPEIANNIDNHPEYSCYYCDDCLKNMEKHKNKEPSYETKLRDSLIKEAMGALLAHALSMSIPRGAVSKEILEKATEAIPSSSIIIANEIMKERKGWTK